MPLEAPQVAEAQAVLALHVDRSADQGSGALNVCADIHDGQILNHRGTMDTEFSDQDHFRPLRSSWFASRLRSCGSSFCG